MIAMTPVWPLQQVVGAAIAGAVVHAAAAVAVK